MYFVHGRSSDHAPLWITLSIIHGLTDWLAVRKSLLRGIAFRRIRDRGGGILRKRARSISLLMGTGWHFAWPYLSLESGWSSW